MAIPLYTTGSLSPTFVPAPPVGVAVKLPSAFALLIEKPQMTYHVNTGMYLCNAKVIEYIGNQEKIDMPDLIKRCIQAGESVGQVVIGKQDWYDMGQPEELELMKKRLHII